MEESGKLTLHSGTTHLVATLNVSGGRATLPLNDPHDRDPWCRRLGVTPQELRRAVYAMGSGIEAVKQYFGRDEESRGSKTGVQRAHLADNRR